MQLSDSKPQPTSTHHPDPSRQLVASTQFFHSTKQPGKAPPNFAHGHHQLHTFPTKCHIHCRMLLINSHGLQPNSDGLQPTITLAARSLIYSNLLPIHQWHSTTGQPFAFGEPPQHRVTSASLLGAIARYVRGSWPYYERSKVRY